MRHPHPLSNTCECGGFKFRAEIICGKCWSKKWDFPHKGYDSLMLSQSIVETLTNPWNIENEEVES